MARDTPMLDERGQHPESGRIELLNLPVPDLPKVDSRPVMGRQQPASRCLFIA